MTSARATIVVAMVVVALATLPVTEALEDYYAALGVPRTADAKTIKSAYRKLAAQLHPDRNDADDAEEKFVRITLMYEVLDNVSERRRYDERLAHFEQTGHDRRGDRGDSYDRRMAEYRALLRSRQTPLWIVVLATVCVISAIQFAYNVYIYRKYQERGREVLKAKQIREAKQSVAGLSKKERQRVLAETRNELEEGSSLPSEIKVHGAEFPSWEDLFVVTVALAPVLIARLVRDTYKYNYLGVPRPLRFKFFNVEQAREWVATLPNLNTQTKERAAKFLHAEGFALPPALRPFVPDYVHPVGEYEPEFELDADDESDDEGGDDGAQLEGPRA